MYSIPNDPDEIKLVDGQIRPARSRSTKCDRILFLADSSQRISGTPFDFQVTAARPIYGQTAYISRMMIPKIPNINSNNNVITITNATGTYNITLPIGYYNQVSLVNIIEAALNPPGLPYGDSFTVTYNKTNKTILVAATALPFYFVNTCSFIVYGINVVHFDAYPPGSVLGTVGTLNHYSSVLGLVYSRYVNVISNRLCASAMDTSRTSQGYSNIVAVISVAEHFNAQDYSPDGLFSGSVLVDQSFNDTAVLRVANQRKDLTAIDFRITDEFGIPLDNALNLGGSYSSNSLSALIWLTITL